MGTRIVFQRRRETDALLNDEPSEDPYFIAKLFGMAFISGGNSGYALNSVGFVLARLVRDAPEPLPEGLGDEQITIDRSARRDASRRAHRPLSEEQVAEAEADLAELDEEMRETLRRIRGHIRDGD